MLDLKAHWEQVHATKGDQVSWYQPASTLSLEMIGRCGLEPGAAVIDVGCGASVLAEALLDLGLRPTLVDLSQAVLDRVRERLGDRAAQVAFQAGDAARLELAESSFDLWHDRAVLHFLTDPGDRASYLAGLRRALRPGGHAVMAAFAPDGPEKCSGLPVCRYDAAGFAEALGPGFELVEEARELHPTPFGTTQAFQYARFRRA